MIAPNRTFLTCILLLLGALTISAQTMNEEIEQLREQLGVSASVSITMANLPDLPKSDPLKVYIAAGFDMDVRERTVERINDWNKKDAKKYGALKVVIEISQADVIQPP